MVEKFVNLFIPTDFKRDKISWVIAMGYLIYFSIGQLENFSFIALWVIFPACILYVFIDYYQHQTTITLEVKLYLLFALWCFFTGLFISKNMDSYTLHIRRIFICFFLMFCSYFGTKKSGNIGIYMFMFFFTSLFICGYSFVMGDLGAVLNQSELSFEEAGVTYITADRLGGLAGNSNGMGEYALYGFISISYLFFEAKKKYIQAFYIATSVLFFYTIVAAGTRGGLFICSLYIVLWILFVLKKQLKAQLVFISLFLLFMSAGYYLFETVIKTSTVGLRLEKEKDISEDSRTKIAYGAVDYVIANPLMGLGVAQLQYNSKNESIAHNDFLEVLTSSGVIGAIFYYGMFGVLTLKLYNQRKKREQKIALNIAYFTTIMITFFAYAFVKEHVWDFSVFMMLGTISGYVEYIKPKPFRV